MSIRSARGGRSERVSSKVPRDSSRVEAGNDMRTLSPTLMKDISCEDDKGRIMEEVMKTYIKQQEKLNSILRRKQQLQMVPCRFDCISLVKSESCCWLVGCRIKMSDCIHLETTKTCTEFPPGLNPDTKIFNIFMLIGSSPPIKGVLSACNYRVQAAPSILSKWKPLLSL